MDQPGKRVTSMRTLSTGPRGGTKSQNTITIASQSAFAKRYEIRCGNRLAPLLSLIIHKRFGLRPTVENWLKLWKAKRK